MSLINSQNIIYYFITKDQLGIDNTIMNSNTGYRYTLYHSYLMFLSTNRQLSINVITVV